MKLMEVREVKPNNNLKIKNMTAVDYLFESLYLFETLWNNPRDEKTKKTWNSILERSKKLEKQQMMDCYLKANLFQRKHEFEQYYDENYVCKGIKGMASSQTEIKDNKIMLLEEDLWCVHKYLDDLNIERNYGDGKQYSIVGRIKLLENRFLYQMSELETNLSTSQTEISDEEIEKAADKYVSEDEFNRYLKCFEEGAKWYREQLKTKQ